MDRRQFLGTATALATLPIDGTATLDGEPAVQTCDVCDAEKPAEMVERTTVDVIAPLETDICLPCQVVHDHALPDGVCDQCGDELDGTGFSIELEHPLGESDLPAFKTGRLCGDCAGWVAGDINFRGLRADDEAAAAFSDLLDAETDRLNALEAGDE